MCNQLGPDKQAAKDCRRQDEEFELDSVDKGSHSAVVSLRPIDSQFSELGYLV